MRICVRIQWKFFDRFQYGDWTEKRYNEEERCVRMEKKLIKKMILNCFKQYYEAESMPISDKDLEELTIRIFQLKEEEPTANLFEVVNDAVYEFLTG
jgi:hypothetical protein